MKKMISILLAATMLITILSISAFADNTTVNRVSVSFTPPSVGDEVPASSGQSYGSAITNVSNSPESYYLAHVVVGSQNVNSFTSSNFTTLDSIAAFCQEHAAPEEYNDQETLLVCYLWIDSAPVSENVTINVESDAIVEYLFTTDPGVMYFYLKFTPQAAQGDTGDDTDDSSEPTTLTGNSHTFEELTSGVIDVNATYIATVEEQTIYSVVITWGSMDFTYTAESKRTWNPSTHSYIIEDSASWSNAEDANLITVTNHSNTAICAAFSFNPAANFNGLEGKFSTENTDATVFTGTKEISSAVNTAYASAPFVNAYLMLSGDLPDGTAKEVKCGTVTVIISDPLSA